jgi:hypothetical protein
VTGDLAASAERVVAAALRGPWTRSGLAERLATSGVEPGAAEVLASRLLVLAPHRPFDTASAAGLLRSLSPVPAPEATLAQPGPPAWRWPVPRWETTGELARALDLEPGELDWFADVRGYNRTAPARLRHYQATWVASGARLIEAPKPRLAGLVVNQAPAVPRREYDALRALLHNCVRTSPAEQYRRSGWDGPFEHFPDYLLGKIGWVAASHPARGRKLRALYDRIEW